MVMRRIGLYVVALCVGSATLNVFWKLVNHFFGLVTGFAALAVGLASLALFIVVTAWVFSVLAAPKPARSRRSQPVE